MSKSTVFAVPSAGETKPMSGNLNPYLERGITLKVEGRYEEALLSFNNFWPKTITQATGTTNSGWFTVSRECSTSHSKNFSVHVR